MNKEETTIGLIFLSKKFYEIGTKTIISLLEETGYFEYFDKISAEDIEVLLKKNSDQIEEWFGYSEDQRCGPAYFIEKKNDSSYMIKYIEGDKINLISEYSDPIKCCANFIKYEVEKIRNNVLKI